VLGLGRLLNGMGKCLNYSEGLRPESSLVMDWWGQSKDESSAARLFPLPFKYSDKQLRIAVSTFISPLGFTLMFCKLDTALLHTALYPRLELVTCGPGKEHDWVDQTRTQAVGPIRKGESCSYS
jgi:hypothetical protein